jgi:hypothetical protein
MIWPVGCRWILLWLHVQLGAGVFLDRLLTDYRMNREFGSDNIALLRLAYSHSSETFYHINDLSGIIQPNNMSPAPGSRYGANDLVMLWTSNICMLDNHSCLSVR